MKYLPMKEIKILQTLPINKEEIDLFAKNVVDTLMDEGFYEPLEIAIRVEAIEKIMKAIKSDDRFKTACLDNADLFPEKTFSFHGIDVTKASSARYDYSGDPVWDDLKAQENAIADKRKEQENILKALKEKSVIDDIERLPAVRIATDHLRFRF